MKENTVHENSSGAAVKGHLEKNTGSTSAPYHKADEISNDQQT